MLMMARGSVYGKNETKNKNNKWETWIIPFLLLKVETVN